ncbi:MAG: hypothetical protein ABH838_03425 [Actinomycetota bacterium]
MSAARRIDEKLNSFIEEYVDSFVKWDLVTFFSYNPDERGTAEQLAGRLGRKPRDIKEALDILAKRKLLSFDTDSGEYAFEPSDDMKARVKSFCDALEDRDLRLEILAKLLRVKATH